MPLFRCYPILVRRLPTRFDIRRSVALPVSTSHFPLKPDLVRLHPSLPSSLAKIDTRHLKVDPVSPPRNFPTALSTSRSYPTRENTRSKLLPGTFYPQSRYLAPCPTLAGHQYCPRSLFVPLVRFHHGLFLRAPLDSSPPDWCFSQLLHPTLSPRLRH
jgi:hypothetical protein